MDLSLSPLPARLRVWLFKDVENVKCVPGKRREGERKIERKKREDAAMATRKQAAEFDETSSKEAAAGTQLPKPAPLSLSHALDRMNKNDKIGNSATRSSGRLPRKKTAKAKATKRTRKGENQNSS